MKHESFVNKIICADVLEAMNQLPDNVVHLWITSPPYNLDIPYENHKDNMPYDKYLKWMYEVWYQSNRTLISGGRLCINIGENKRQDIPFPTYAAFVKDCMDIGMLYRGTIIWNKQTAAKRTAWGSWCSPSNPHVVPRHEYILVFSKSEWKLEGSSKDSDITPEEFTEYTKTIWTFPPVSKKRVRHPAPFPEELPYRLIKLYSFPGNIVGDMFGGSGTTGIVASKINRNFILIDNSISYCRLALSKIANRIYFEKNSKDGNTKIITVGDIREK